MRANLLQSDDCTFGAQLRHEASDESGGNAVPRLALLPRHPHLCDDDDDDDDDVDDDDDKNREVCSH